MRRYCLVDFSRTWLSIAKLDRFMVVLLGWCYGCRPLLRWLCNLATLEDRPSGCGAELWVWMPIAVLADCLKSSWKEISECVLTVLLTIATILAGLRLSCDSLS